MIQKANLTCELFPQEKKELLLQNAHVAIAKSGTITLELALCKVPTLVTYGVSILDQFIVQKILSINLPFYCIANILLSQEIFPEFFGPKLKIDPLFASLKMLWENEEMKDQMKEKCTQLQKVLGNHNPQLVASTVLDLM